MAANKGADAVQSSAAREIGWYLNSGEVRCGEVGPRWKVPGCHEDAHLLLRRRGEFLDCDAGSHA